MNLKNGNKNTFEIQTKNEEEKLGFYGVRHTVALMCFLSYLISFAMRNALSVAIVAMVNSTKTVQSNRSAFKEGESCPLPEEYHHSVDNIYSEGEFDWSDRTVGIILGSFYYGYILTNVAGGRAADYWGARRVLGLSVMLASVAMMLSPLSARVSPVLLVVMRIIEGITAGFGYPAMNSLLAQWYPKEERSKFAAFVFSANQIGTVVSMGVTGWISSSDHLGGWPTVFYLFGFLGIAWGIFWFWLISEGPQEHPRISDMELKFILKGCPTSTEPLPVPWKAIFTSKYFWIIALADAGAAWSLLTLLQELPTYLDKVLHIDLLKNGVFSALPFLGAWLFSIVISISLNKLFTNNIISLLTMRRVAMAISGYIPAIGMIVICFTNCNSKLAIVIFVILGTALGAMYCSVLCSDADIAPRFAGTMLGLSNTLACIPGFISPSLTSAITQNKHTLSSWRIIFIIYVVISVVTSTVYIIFITTDIQPFNDPEFLKKDKKENCSNNLAHSFDQRIFNNKSNV